jgi:hypothetical protein
MDPSEFLVDTTVRVPAARYAVARVDPDEVPDVDAFAVLRDERETTVVVDEARLDEFDPLAVEGGWRRLTFDVVLPFDLVGFLAVVAGELAEVGVSIFALSAYSTDHLLVREADLPAAAERLEALGCDVRRLDDGT